MQRKDLNFRQLMNAIRRVMAASINSNKENFQISLMKYQFKGKKR